MKPYTSVISFPNFRDFLEWLKFRGIKEMGRVIVQHFTTGEKGVTFVRYSYKMTAKDPERQEIVECLLPFYSGIWINKDVTEKEAAPIEEKFRAWLDETIKDFHEKNNYGFNVILAEFKAIGEP